MKIENLNKELYNTLIAAGVTSFTLQFQGGSDEGYLNVIIDSKNQLDITNHRDLEKLIEDWAWDTYGYSGAGDGNDYGDNITYNLETLKVDWKEWSMVPQYSNRPESEFQII